MVAEKKRMTTAEFEAFASRPENRERHFELINGEIVEKMGSTTYNAQIPMLLAALVIAHCDTNNLPCFITGADGEYCIGDWYFIPDFAYKTTPVSLEFPDRVPPVWAVEVISANENPAEKRRKYIDARMLLWEVYPNARAIDIYAPDKPMTTAYIGSVISVDAVPGLTIEVARLFR
jgi:Uma2 family endonuclease